MIETSNAQEIDLNTSYLEMPLNKLFSFKPSKTNISYGTKIGIKRDKDNYKYEIFADKKSSKIYQITAIEKEKDEGLRVLYKYKFLENSKNEIIDLEKITVDKVYELLTNLSKPLDYYFDKRIHNAAEVFTKEFDMYFNRIYVLNINEMDRQFLLEYIMDFLDEEKIYRSEKNEDSSKIYEKYEKKFSKLEKKLLENNVVEMVKTVLAQLYRPKNYPIHLSSLRQYFGYELEEREKETLDRFFNGSKYGLIMKLYNKDFDYDLKIRKLIYSLQETINSEEKKVIIKEIETMMISCDYEKLVSLIWSLITINNSNLGKKVNGVDEFLTKLENSSLIYKLENFLFRNYNQSQIYEVKERIVQLISILKNKSIKSEKFLLRLLIYPDYCSKAVINTLDKNIDKKSIDDVIGSMDYETIELQRKKYKILYNMFSNKPE